MIVASGCHRRAVNHADVALPGGVIYSQRMCARRVRAVEARSHSPLLLRHELSIYRVLAYAGREGERAWQARNTQGGHE
eukprot:2122903-Prymnesium_polylepis.3